MCMTNEAAAIKLAERDNLVGELVGLLEEVLSIGWGSVRDIYGHQFLENTKNAIAKAREGAQS